MCSTSYNTWYTTKPFTAIQCFFKTYVSKNFYLHDFFGSVSKILLTGFGDSKKCLQHLVTVGQYADICDILAKTNTVKLYENNIFLLWITPNPKISPLRGISTRRLIIGFYFPDDFWIFLEGNSPEGRKKFEHQIRPKGGFYLLQKVKKNTAAIGFYKINQPLISLRTLPRVRDIKAISAIWEVNHQTSRICAFSWKKKNNMLTSE